MKREFPPVYLALFLILGCVTFRLLSSRYPDFIPNVSPLMAIAYVGAMYLPRKWGWMVGPATLVVTDLAFTQLNLQAGMPMFEWSTVVSLLIYAAAGALGIFISQRKSLVKIVSGSLLCSLVFYVVGNTYAWAGGAVSSTSAGYPMTFAGWWQANTVGLPGWAPTWLFLRNGMAGDLFFSLLLLLVLDRGILVSWYPKRATVRV